MPHGKVRRIIWTSILAFAVLAIGDAHSKSSTGPHHDKIRQTQQTPQAEQRVASPPPITVNITPAPKTDAEAAGEKRERDQKTANDTTLIVIGKVQSAIFGLQLLVFLFQWRVFSKQANFMRQTVSEMEKGTLAAVKAADAAAASSDAFINSKRPHIAIRPTLTFLNTAFPHIECDFMNIGESLAFVSDYRMEIYCGKALPHKRKFRYAKLWHGWRPLRQDAVIPGKSTQKKGLTPNEIAEVHSGQIFVFFFGYVIFEDMFENRRERGFALKYLQSERVFTPCRSKRYNYEKCTNNTAKIK